VRLVQARTVDFIYLTSSYFVVASFRTIATTVVQYSIDAAPRSYSYYIVSRVLIIDRQLISWYT
jgi:hypothetical protein